MEETPAVSRNAVTLPMTLSSPVDNKPPPSPLSGAYLLVLISEPRTEAHKSIILQKLTKGFLSWNIDISGVDIERELAIVTALSPEGDYAKNGERLIQNASEHLVTEILINPQINTMRQCIRNLLSSFTKYRFILHAGYTFCGSGSWILQDGTFSTSDFIDAFQEIEVQRVIRAYEKTIQIDICCICEGSWNQNRLNRESFSKYCRVEINPPDRISPGNAAVREFVQYMEKFIEPRSIDELLPPSDVVGNIRFTHPTLYVFPGGEGDAALFGINGFNMLVDGGFNRKACFWNFVRHLDRLDAVLLTRLNNNNVGGVSGMVERKVHSHVYPQIGHFFSNIQARQHLSSSDGNKDYEPLLINLFEEGNSLLQNLKRLELKPHHCYRNANGEPINLYHKVGHGKLDMYVVSPAKDSPEVREFLNRWKNYDVKLFARNAKNATAQDSTPVIPTQNLVSICALLVWQPANPENRVTRILFPGSVPQSKIIEGLEKMKHLEFFKHAICTMKSILPIKEAATQFKNRTKTTVTKNEKIISNETSYKNDAKLPFAANNETNDIVKLATEKKISVRKVAEKSAKDVIDQQSTVVKGETTDAAAKIEEKKKPETKRILKTTTETKSKPPSSLVEKKPISEKSPPSTPKKIVHSSPGKEQQIKAMAISRPPARTKTPPRSLLAAKNLKEENNRKMAEIKPPPRTRTPPKTTVSAAKTTNKKVDDPPVIVKVEKKIMPIKKPKPLTKQPSSPPSTVKKTAPVKSLKTDEIKKVLRKTDKIVSNVVPSKLDNESTKINVVESVAKEGDIAVEDTATYISSIISREGKDGEEDEEILVIETTKNEALRSQEHKYLQDEKESEKDKTLEQVENTKLFQEQIDGAEEHVNITKEKYRDKQKVEKLTPEEQEKIFDQVQGIITSATEILSKTRADDLQQDKLNEKLMQSSPKENLVSDENLEKHSIFESSSTTAPTMPEDEKIEEMKQDIEEKQDTEETKEQSANTACLLGTKPAIQKNIPNEKLKRDAVKTPDEVADLPVYEEADHNMGDSNLVLSHVKATITEPQRDIIQMQHAEYVTMTPTPISTPDERQSFDPEQLHLDINRMEKSSDGSDFENKTNVETDGKERKLSIKKPDIVQDDANIQSSIDDSSSKNKISISNDDEKYSKCEPVEQKLTAKLESQEIESTKILFKDTGLHEGEILDKIEADKSELKSSQNILEDSDNKAILNSINTKTQSITESVNEELFSKICENGSLKSEEEIKIEHLLLSNDEKEATEISGKLEIDQSVIGTETDVINAEVLISEDHNVSLDKSDSQCKYEVSNISPIHDIANEDCTIRNSQLPSNQSVNQTESETEPLQISPIIKSNLSEDKLLVSSHYSKDSVESEISPSTSNASEKVLEENKQDLQVIKQPLPSSQEDENHITEYSATCQAGIQGPDQLATVTPELSDVTKLLHERMNISDKSHSHLDSLKKQSSSQLSSDVDKEQCDQISASNLEKTVLNEVSTAADVRKMSSDVLFSKEDTQLKETYENTSLFNIHIEDKFMGVSTDKNEISPRSPKNEITEFSVEVGKLHEDISDNQLSRKISIPELDLSLKCMQDKDQILEHDQIEVTSPQEISSQLEEIDSKSDITDSQFEYDNTNKPVKVSSDFSSSSIRKSSSTDETSKDTQISIVADSLSKVSHELVEESLHKIETNEISSVEKHNETAMCQEILRNEDLVSQSGYTEKLIMQEALKDSELTSDLKNEQIPMAVIEEIPQNTNITSELRNIDTFITNEEMGENEIDELKKEEKMTIEEALKDEKMILEPMLEKIIDLESEQNEELDIKKTLQNERKFEKISVEHTSPNKIEISHASEIETKENEIADTSKHFETSVSTELEENDKLTIKEALQDKQTISVCKKTDQLTIEEVLKDKQSILELEENAKLTIKETSKDEQTISKLKESEALTIKEALQDKKIPQSKEVEASAIVEKLQKEESIIESNKTQECAIKEVLKDEEAILEVKETEKSIIKDISHDAEMNSKLEETKTKMTEKLLETEEIVTKLKTDEEFGIIEALKDKEIIADLKQTEILTIEKAFQDEEITSKLKEIRSMPTNETDTKAILEQRIIHDGITLKDTTENVTTSFKIKKAETSLTEEMLKNKETMSQSEEMGVILAGKMTNEEVFSELRNDEDQNLQSEKNICDVKHTGTYIRGALQDEEIKFKSQETEKVATEQIHRDEKEILERGQTDGGIGIQEALKDEKIKTELKQTEKLKIEITLQDEDIVSKLKGSEIIDTKQTSKDEQKTLDLETHKKCIKVIDDKQSKHELKQVETLPLREKLQNEMAISKSTDTGIVATRNYPEDEVIFDLKKTDDEFEIIKASEDTSISIIEKSKPAETSTIEDALENKKLIPQLKETETFAIEEVLQDKTVISELENSHISTVEEDLHDQELALRISNNNTKLQDSRKTSLVETNNTSIEKTASNYVIDTPSDTKRILSTMEDNSDSIATSIDTSVLIKDDMHSVPETNSTVKLHSHSKDHSSSIETCETIESNESHLTTTYEKLASIYSEEEKTPSIAQEKVLELTSLTDQHSIQEEKISEKILTANSGTSSLEKQVVGGDEKKLSDASDQRLFASIDEENELEIRRSSLDDSTELSTCDSMVSSTIAWNNQDTKQTSHEKISPTMDSDSADYSMSGSVTFTKIESISSSPEKCIALGNTKIHIAAHDQDTQITMVTKSNIHECKQDAAKSSIEYLEETPQNQEFLKMSDIIYQQGNKTDVICDDYSNRVESAIVKTDEKSEMQLNLVTEVPELNESSKLITEITNIGDVDLKTHARATCEEFLDEASSLILKGKINIEASSPILKEKINIEQDIQCQYQQDDKSKDYFSNISLGERNVIEIDLINESLKSEIDSDCKKSPDERLKMSPDNHIGTNENNVNNTSIDQLSPEKSVDLANTSTATISSDELTSGANICYKQSKDYSLENTVSTAKDEQCMKSDHTQNSASKVEQVLSVDETLTTSIHSKPDHIIDETLSKDVCKRSHSDLSYEEEIFEESQETGASKIKIIEGAEKKQIVTEVRSVQQKESFVEEIKPVVSPEVQMDATELSVKFSSDKKDDHCRKFMSKSVSDEMYDSTSTFVQDTIGDLNTQYGKKEPVSKTVSLPILDEQFELNLRLSEADEESGISSTHLKSPLDKKSLVEITKVSTNLSDPSLNTQIQGELQSKSVSMPVIKQFDESEKYMTLPYLYKTANLEDLSTMPATVLARDQGGVNKENLQDLNLSTETKHDKDLPHLAIQTEEMSEKNISSSGDTSNGADMKTSTKKLKEPPFKSTAGKSGCETTATALSYGSAEEVGFGMSSSMIQSFYGSFPDLDDEQQDEEIKEALVLEDRMKEKSDDADEKSNDPIQSWGKPLGLPESRFTDPNYIWSQIEYWGKPMLLPSPGGPVPKREHRDSNGDIEISLSPVNSKKSQKLLNKKTNGKSSSTNEETKLKDIMAKKRQGKQTTPFFVDLAYVPHHGNPYYSTVEFFNRIRARYYVFSGTDPSKDILNALLEAKKSWEDQDLEVTIISTYDTDALGFWLMENEETLVNLKIDVAPSASRCTINLQDHDTSCSAYRLEF